MLFAPDLQIVNPPLHVLFILNLGAPELYGRQSESKKGQYVSQADSSLKVDASNRLKDVE
jgi:hypothetical protein